MFEIPPVVFSQLPLSRIPLFPFFSSLFRSSLITTPQNFSSLASSFLHALLLPFDPPFSSLSRSPPSFKQMDRAGSLDLFSRGPFFSSRKFPRGRLISSSFWKNLYTFSKRFFSFLTSFFFQEIFFRSRFLGFSRTS